MAICIIWNRSAQRAISTKLSTRSRCRRAHLLFNVVFSVPGARRHVILLSKKARVLVEEDIFFNKKTGLFVEQEDNVFLFKKKTCLRVQHEDMASGWRWRHVFLLSRKKCSLVQRQGMFSNKKTSLGSTRRHVLLFNKKTRFLFFPLALYLKYCTNLRCLESSLLD